MIIYLTDSKNKGHWVLSLRKQQELASDGTILKTTGDEKATVELVNDKEIELHERQDHKNDIIRKNDRKFTKRHLR